MELELPLLRSMGGWNYQVSILSCQVSAIIKLLMVSILTMTLISFAISMTLPPPNPINKFCFHSSTCQINFVLHRLLAQQVDLFISLKSRSIPSIIFNSPVDSYQAFTGKD